LKFGEEQMPTSAGKSRGATLVDDVCRQIGVREATFYVWEKQYAHLGVAEVRRMRQLEEENNRLKGLVADLTLDKHMLSEALRQSG
jgi:putative transposase